MTKFEENNYRVATRSDGAYHLQKRRHLLGFTIDWNPVLVKREGYARPEPVCGEDRSEVIQKAVALNIIPPGTTFDKFH
jgi:hypothetical protein